MATSEISPVDTAPDKPPLSRRRWPWVVAAIALFIVIIIASFDWNWFKGPIERRVQAATGRAFEIRGDLDVDLGLRPRIRADGLRFANAQWSKDQEMATVERLEFRIALLPLLRGRFEFPYLRANTPVVVVERNRDGVGNWVFDSPKKQSSDGKPASVLVNQLFIDNGELHVREPTFKTDVALKVRSGKPDKGQLRAPLLASGAGTYRGSPFELNVRVDSPLNLQDRERPYHVDARVSAGATRARARGALLGQLQLQDFNVRFDLAGADLGDLYPLLGVALPETPPYELKGQLDRNGAIWSYKKFTGRVGDSDLRGDMSVDLSSERARLTAKLVSQRLDFDDLGALVGAPPSTQDGESASKAQREAAAKLDARQKVLPDSQFNLAKLRTMDADVSLRAEQINSPRLPLEKMNVHLKLEDGVMNLDPFDFNAAGGVIDSKLNLDAREQLIKTTLTAEVRDLQLPKLFPKMELTKTGAGALSGAVALQMTGNSVADMFGTADGDVGLIMGPGHISNLLVELAGLDIAESIKYLFDKNKQIPLRCAYADFHSEDGIMVTRALAFDTTDTVIHAEGGVNLREEVIDMKLVPQPKDRSPLSLRVPLKVGGTFKDPSFVPEVGPLALRSAAAAALYALAPPAALLALIETGPGKNKNIDCGAAGNPKGNPAAK